eukprot:Clim_evm53s11 gene=Clim_evmTU53s11
MAEDLQLETNVYDVVILGSGITECITAAAIARTGRKVLQLDSRSEYGGQAMCNISRLSQIKNVCTHSLDLHQAAPVSAEQGVDTFPTDHKPFFMGFEEVQPGDAEVDGFAPDARERLEKLSRGRPGFNFTTIPMALLSSDQMVELLIRSNVGSYVEFRAADQVQFLEQHDAESMAEPVPSSKGQIFSSKTLSMVEKRLLMRFLGTIAPAMEALQSGDAGDVVDMQDGKPMIAHLLEAKLPARLNGCILYAMSGATTDQARADLPTEEILEVKYGMQNLATYLSSIGRFAESPFLFPFYGPSELPQGFARFAAVLGAVQILGFFPDELSTDVSEVAGAIAEDSEETQSGPQFKLHIRNTQQNVYAHDVVMAAELAPQGYTSYMNHPRVARAVVLVTGPLPCFLGKGLAVLTVPPNTCASNPNPVSLVQLDSTVNACPSNTWLLQFETTLTPEPETGRVPSAKEALHSIVKESFHWQGRRQQAATTLGAVASVHGADGSSSNSLGTVGEASENVEEAARVLEAPDCAPLYIAYYSQRALKASAPSDQRGVCAHSPNVHIIDTPSEPDLVCRKAVRRARRIFERICPGEEFLEAVLPPEEQAEIALQNIPSDDAGA